MPSSAEEYLLRIWEWIEGGAHVISSGGGGGGGGPATIADGDDATLGSKADDKVTTTDTTPVTIMSVLKGILYGSQVSKAGGAVDWNTLRVTTANNDPLNNSIGTDITTPTAMPAGGAGIRGWLSAIWTKLNGSLAVTGTFWPTTQPVSTPKSTFKIEVEVTGLTTPTTAYTAGMVLGFAGPVVLVELPNVVPANGGGGFITGLKISTNKKSVVPILRVHLFNASNPTVAVDRALWEDLYADISKRIIYYDMPAMSSAGNASTDMSRTIDQTFRPIEFLCAAGSTSLWFALEIGSVGFTPDAGEKYTLTVWVNDNV